MSEYRVLWAHTRVRCGFNIEEREREKKKEMLQFHDRIQMRVVVIQRFLYQRQFRNGYL